MLGLSVAGCTGAVASLVIIHSGTGPTMAGEHAEQWTASELRPLLKLGHQLVNHVDVDGRGDADHVLIGPSGLFVLETKWSAEPWTPDSPWLYAAVAGVKRRHRRTWLQLKPHGARGGAPVLVLWGRAAEHLRTGSGEARVDDTYIIAGPNLQRWMLSRTAGQMTADEITSSHGTLCAMALRGDARAEPVPPSVEQILDRLLLRGGAAIAAFLAPWLATQVHPAGVGLALPLVALGILRRAKGHIYTGTPLLGAVAALALLLGASLTVLV